MLQHLDSVAVSYQSQNTSYYDLFRRAASISLSLRSIGIKRDVIVCLSIPEGLEAILCILGIIMAGGSVCPLCPDYPLARLTYIIDDTAAPFVIVSKETENRLEKAIQQTQIKGVRFEDLQVEKESRKEIEALNRNQRLQSEQIEALMSGLQCTGSETEEIDQISIMGLIDILFEEEVLQSDPCVVVYTSGSTGTPKGVVQEHQNYIAFITGR